ncbi:ArsR family transcriptional regulator [Mesorhizobium sp. LNJC380A00]|uniref:ArsR family transcriptional regulator n=1 Tax=Mesorhizobium sp. LNJC380A00 TaxID=1287264 RepID=UPI0003CF1639|nr:ArsR family transcriptional regulator [Mesorhizobium sp. LNJC380A00]ESY48420.1 ArsR family transcriptional regulator [Mesorhizobium sp. LNJC380A00]
MQEVDVFKAIANERRLQILDWLKDPQAHFPAQADGDLVEDGVCALLIAEKLGITPKRIKQWTFYRRDEDRIADTRMLIQNRL